METFAAFSESTAPHGDFNIRYIALSCSVAALGGLLFGYDYVVIGGAKPFYEAFFGLRTSVEIGWANSCALLGCLLGSLLCGFFSDRYGRKKLLLLSALLFAISSLFTGLSFTFKSFVTWRVIGGIAIGIASNASPTYIAEVSPAVWRGRLVSLNQMTIVLGILLAQIVNWLIASPVPENASEALIRNSWNGQTGWRLMFEAVIIPSILFFISALFVPESPRWLISQGSTKQAHAVFAKVGGEAYASVAVSQVEAAAALSTQTEHKPFASPAVRRALLIGVVLAVLQQWSGINVLFNYAEEIYKQAGYSVNGILFNIVITGAINVLFTIVALRTVDRWGRRSLMLIGCACVAVCHLLIGSCYSFGVSGLPLLFATLLTIGSYAMSLAPVTWVLIAEIFPLRFRGEGIAISVSALWIASFLLTFTFPLLNAALGGAGTFFLYALICSAGFVFVYFAVAETKGKSLEQIEQQLASS